jgi:hypothetical protein
MNLSLRKLAAKFVCLVAAIFIADGAPADSAPPLPARERALIMEAYNLWSVVADDVWPGTSSVRAPFVYVGGQHEYAIGFPRLLPVSETAGTACSANPFKFEIARLLLTSPHPFRCKTFLPS